MAESARSTVSNATARKRTATPPRSPVNSDSVSSNLINSKPGANDKVKAAQNAAEQRCSWSWLLLSREEQEWVLGVASPYVMLPFFSVIGDIYCGQTPQSSWHSHPWLKDSQSVLPMLMAMHVVQTIVSIALWRQYSMTCRRVYLDRGAAIVLSSSYFALSALKGGQLLLEVAVGIVIFAFLFLSTFWTEPRTGQYLGQHLLFRYIAFGTSLLVLYNQDEPSKIKSMLKWSAPSYVAFALFAVWQARCKSKAAGASGRRLLCLKAGGGGGFGVYCTIGFLWVAGTAVLERISRGVCSATQPQGALQLPLILGASLAAAAIFVAAVIGTGELRDPTLQVDADKAK
eukprot:TRINITY_DN32774_c0_g1_i1.p1 TRINITY_DN32774_c0_g1~~TRINITY_DN32774_c0_g1_i1.p1  ORF type:complete len:359 (-),score=47.59 TRINITY_DN32774_c0_g1_i1:32-1063(-)